MTKEKVAKYTGSPIRIARLGLSTMILNILSTYASIRESSCWQRSVTFVSIVAQALPHRQTDQKKKRQSWEISPMFVLPMADQTPVLRVLILSAFVNNILPSALYEVDVL